MNVTDGFSYDKIFERLKGNNVSIGTISPEVQAGMYIQAFIVIIGILANILIAVITLFGSTRYESSSITYVTNLAVSNLVFLSMVPLKLVEDIHLRWIFGNGLCKLTVLTKFLNFTVLAFFLMAMSVDRYLAVNKPLSSGHLRSKRASIIVSLTLWIVSFVLSLPFALLHSNEGKFRCIPQFPDQQFLENFYNEVDEQHPGAVCRYTMSSVLFRTWTICNFIYNFVIPFLVMVISYCAIVHRVRNPTGIVNNKGKHQRMVKRKVTQMAVILVISYAVCYFPFYVWQIWKLVGVQVAVGSTCARVDRFNNTMAYLNSALHPILYACTSGQFYKQYIVVKKKLMKCCKVGNRQKMTATSIHTKRTFIRTNGLASGEIPEQLTQPLSSYCKNDRKLYVEPNDVRSTSL